MSFAGEDVTRGLIAKLSASLSVGVYTDPPDAAEYPFIVVQSVTADDVSTAGEDGQLFSVVLHVWSDYDGAKEILDLLGQMYNALHKQQITLTAHAFGGCYVTGTDTYADPDGKVFHGIMTARIYATG